MIFILGGVFLFLLASKKTGQKFSYTVDNSAFVQAFYKWVSEKEGHKPDNSNVGGNINVKIAPCEITYNGKLYKNIKSVGGITYGTFEELSKIYHYEPSCENFASLSGHQSSPIWLLTVDHFRKKGLAFTKDPIQAGYIGFWYWGAWRPGIVSTQDVKDVLNSHDSPTVILRRLVDLRIYYFTELGKLVPQYRADGSVDNWIEGANKYFAMMSPFYKVDPIQPNA